MKESNTNLQNATYEILNGYAEESWTDNTYVLEFDDTIPTSVLRKLLKFTDTYPHDTVVMFDNTITFISLGGHTVDNIQFKVNITRKHWRARARRYARRMEVPAVNEEDYLSTAYVLSLITGGSVTEYFDRWAPTVIDEGVPCAI